MSTLPPITSPAGWDVVLTDGSTARVRPVSPADIPEIKALHARLSRETVRLRYFGAHPRLPEDELTRLVEAEGPAPPNPRRRARQPVGRNGRVRPYTR